MSPVAVLLSGHSEKEEEEEDEDIPLPMYTYIYIHIYIYMSMCHLMGALKYERVVKFGKGYSTALGPFRPRGALKRAWAQALKRAQGDP